MVPLAGILPAELTALRGVGLAVALTLIIPLAALALAEAASALSSGRKWSH